MARITDTNTEQNSSSTQYGFDVYTSFDEPDVGLAEIHSLDQETLQVLYGELYPVDDAIVAEDPEGTAAALLVPNTLSVKEKASYEAALAELVLYGESAETTEDTIATSPSTAEAPMNLIHGDQHDNVIVGTDGRDHIRLYGGDDVAFGLEGGDEILGWTGNDVLFGGRGGDGLYGGDGNDILFGGRVEDFMQGGDGNDILVGGFGKSEQYGGLGDDVMFGADKADLYDGDAGFDTVSFELAEDGVTALLWLDGAQDTGQGMDTFVDVENLIGSDHDDQLSGDSGGNRLEGGAGADRLDGGDGNDYVAGGEGNDVLAGGRGNDIFDGGAGIDTASFTGSAFGVVVNLSLGFAQNTEQGIDSFLDIENVSGSSLGDLISGDGGVNVIRGNEGGDWILGGGDDDTILGDDGNDVIVGEGGTDLLFGGAGADAFFYGSMFGDDYIYDFENGVDKIYVDDNFGTSSFSDITIEDGGFGSTVATFSGGSITLTDVSPDQIGADDFVFY